MKYLLILPRSLWKIWFVLNFIVTLLLLYPFFALLLSREAWFGACFRLMRIWAHWLCYVAGIVPRLRYHFDSSQLPTPCVIVSNHSSYLDIVLSYVAFSRYFIFVGKQELDKAPLFRIFFKRMNILVNRKSTLDSHKAFLQAGQRIDQKQNVFIFPEATISPSGVLIPFKNGAFKLAIDKQVPIVPLVFHDNWKLLQTGGFLKANGRPGLASMDVLEPVPTKGLTNADLLPLREKVKSLLHQHLQTGHKI